MSEQPTTASTELTKADSNLIWLDCEMTGLDPDKERIIEIALIITNQDLSIRLAGPNLVIHQSDELLNKMDAWNKSMHGKNGLIEKVKNSVLSEQQVEEQLLSFIRQYVPKNKSPMCGNTISQDRRFLCKYMPKLEAYFHYRNLDVSSLKELAKRWRSDLKFNKKQKHTALSDTEESIEELIYYRDNFLKI